MLGKYESRRKFKKGVINCVSLQRISKRHWYLVLSDKLWFFSQGYSEIFMIGRSGLEKLRDEIDKALEAD